ncbi:hypothetical protein GBA65_04505 [Rubrobacter marinus]|uniref:YmcC n=1 Tax=Rubrobacter marinus TaxID=2653852 RepID=A0A6G8PTS5_9ACTN|nr:hypothetical protein [Rubrobacter marinus]QIN77899.1 hypothetical protein GBA65_04505 [Rubrobacter marinus]
MIYAVIVACEVGFWVVLLAGLAARYGLRRPRLGAALLVCVPLVDLTLLGASVLDLRQGGEADFAHGLAAVYLGVSVAWGHSMVRWADARFAHRFAGGPVPSRPPAGGVEHARYQRGQWARHLLAWAVGCALLLGGVALVGDADRSAALLGIAQTWTLVLAVDFLWSMSYTLWPRRAPARREGIDGSV